LARSKSCGALVSKRLPRGVALTAEGKNVRRRVDITTLIPIGLLGMAVLVVLAQVNRIRDAAEWLEHTSEAIRYCANVESTAREHKTAVLRGLLGIDTRDDELSARTRTQDALLRLEHHVFDNEAQLHQVRELNARFRTWLEFTRELRHLPGERDRNLQELEQIKRTFEPLITSVNELGREERRLHATRSSEFSATTNLALYGTVPGLLVLLVALGLFHRSQMLRLARDFREAMSGQEAARSDLAQQNWVKEQLVSLIGSTRDEPGLSALGVKLLDCLAKATNVAVAAFYVWDEAAMRWDNHARHGLVHGVAASFGEGEGLVGQAGTHTNVTSFEGVTDEFFAVQSGTGQGDARKIVFIPCHHDGHVLAVVELGFFEQVSERVERLLHQCGESMGIAVSVTKKRLAQRELLLESRRQGEALQAQQEELRVTNEELASHGEALRLAHAQLEERKEELETSNADLVRQRDAVSAAREDLAGRAWELRQANRYKSEFLASMSHELRTPLNSCLILSRALADNKSGNLTEEQVKFAATIHSSGTDLLELINTVLDLSKIEAGAIEFFYDETTVGELVTPVVRIMEPIANERKLRFLVRTDEPAAVIRVDALRTQQILKNLLSNACKFTVAGEVALNVEVREEEIEFKITDTGVGIADDQIEAIFEAFRQADGTASRRFGGTGLGLTISRDLAHRMGGDIRVKSQLGHGSEFVLVLPRQTMNVAPLKRSATIHPLDDEPTAPAREVLLVRRDDEQRADVERIIESWEFVVTRVASNAEALLQLGMRPLAAVVGQRGDGIDDLRQEAKRHRVPLHVIDQLAGQESKPSRVLQHLRKPADEAELRRALSTLFERRNPSDAVLLVEDDDVLRQALALVLEENNVRVTSTATIDGALKALHESTFACVVLDLKLGDGRGESLLQTIASNDAYSFPHVIVYTGEALTGEQEQELLRFSDAVILKGVRSEERLLDELTLFLSDVNANSQRLPPAKDKRPSTRPKGGGANLKGRRVLLVEDDVRNVYALTSVLEREGVKVEIARNGRQALEKLDAVEGVELVLMDIMMPEMNGLEAMRAIRSSQATWQVVPIIALTAKAMRDDRTACLEAGANDYVTKPIDIDKLLSLMRIWLDRA
jgi:signal transduction histidine kinase/CheY-like chemotaxis protein